MVLFLLACSGPASSPPSDGPSDSPDSGDSTSLPLDPDPILERAALRPAGFWEFLDAGFVDEERVAFVGVGGLLMADIETGAELYRDEGLPIANRMALDGERAWLANGSLEVVEVQLGSDSLTWSEQRTEGQAIDVAAQDGLLYLAAGHLGLQVFEDGSLVGSFGGDEPGARASVVVVEGDRALLLDQDKLTLLDLSTPSSPKQLDQTLLEVPGRDLALQGERAAVGLGSAGVQLFSLAGDRLEEAGELELPGSALRLALDEELLWIAGWELTALAHWPEGEEAVIVGHELPRQSAMGVAAQGGLAAIAGWGENQLLEATGSKGPELHLPEEVQVEPGSTRRLNITNWGAQPLELELAGESLEIAPGGVAAITLELQDESVTDLDWTSNDPDEPSGSLKLSPTDEILGTEHVDFTLEGFEGFEGEIQTTTLSEHRGEVVLLAYWSSW